MSNSVGEIKDQRKAGFRGTDLRLSNPSAVLLYSVMFLEESGPVDP